MVSLFGYFNLRNNQITMEIIQIIFAVIIHLAMLAILVLAIRSLIIKRKVDNVKDYTQSLDFVFALIKLKDQYRAYGYEAEAKELDERIKELLAKIEL